jgi:hypothetical protein
VLGFGHRTNAINIGIHTRDRCQKQEHVVEIGGGYNSSAYRTGGGEAVMGAAVRPGERRRRRQERILVLAGLALDSSLAGRKTGPILVLALVSSQRERLENKVLFYWPIGGLRSKLIPRRRIQSARGTSIGFPGLSSNTVLLQLQYSSACGTAYRSVYCCSAADLDTIRRRSTREQYHKIRDGAFFFWDITARAFSVSIELELLSD